MDPEYIILLYSKYSPQCQRITDVLKHSPHPYIKPVCIDNKQIRFNIISSNYNITSVPCVLLVYPDKTIEKYESPNLTDWLFKLITANSEETSTPLERQSEVTTPTMNDPRGPKNDPPPSPQVDTVGSMTSIDAIMNDDESMELFTPPQPPPRPKTTAEMAAEMQKAREDTLQPAFKPTAGGR